MYKSLLRKYHVKTDLKEGKGKGKGNERGRKGKGKRKENGKEKGKTRTFLDTIMSVKIMLSD